MEIKGRRVVKDAKDQHGLYTNVELKKFKLDARCAVVTKTPLSN